MLHERSSIGNSLLTDFGFFIQCLRRVRRLPICWEENFLGRLVPKNLGITSIFLMRSPSVCSLELPSERSINLRLCCILRWRWHAASLSTIRGYLLWIDSHGSLGLLRDFKTCIIHRCPWHKLIGYLSLPSFHELLQMLIVSHVICF